MIHQIDIDRFGSFDGFQWKAAVRDSGNNVQSFKKLNILYGRNYSGKTTLSRVFRSLETRALPWGHDDARFLVRGDRGEVAHGALGAHAYDVRVYNKDFVNENLSFLSDQRNGRIETFAIVGGENNALAERIAAAQASLGSVEGKTGARHASVQAATKAAKAARAAKDATDKLGKL